MSYLARWKAEFPEKRLVGEPTKPTKAPSVSYVSTLSRHISEVKGTEARSDTLPDPRAEARRQRVLAMLAENPTKRYAMLTQDDDDPEGVCLTLAIRGRATCELRIPRDRYDPFLLRHLIERHSGTIH